MGGIFLTRIAAFFDIDGTIYREGLITELFKKVLKYELIEEDVWKKEVEPAYLKWDRREGDYDTYLIKMVEVFIQAIEGINKNHIDHMANRVISQKGDRIYTFSRERIQWHKDQGHVVIAISGSPEELVSKMAQKYNMDDYRATIYQTDENNNYNGTIIPMWDSASKIKALKELQEKYDIDLSQSYAYGDTTGDVTMFEAVGYPYAINPNKALVNKILEDEELKERLNIILERKDVRYKIKLEHTEII